MWTCVVIYIWDLMVCIWWKYKYEAGLSIMNKNPHKFSSVRWIICSFHWRNLKRIGNQTRESIGSDFSQSSPYSVLFGWTTNLVQFLKIMLQTRGYQTSTSTFSHKIAAFPVFRHHHGHKKCNFDHWLIFQYSVKHNRAIISQCFCSTNILVMFSCSI